jgi:RimJ/RimL family protein N-acetyltransferase
VSELRWDRRDTVAAFVLRECKQVGAWDKFEALGLFRGDELLAGAVFTDYMPGGSIEIHVAARPGARWATLAALKAAFRYAFLRNNVRRVAARIAERNERSWKLAEKLGFEREGRAKSALPDDNLLFYGLLRENCRFLE